MSTNTAGEFVLLKEPMALLQGNLSCFNVITTKSSKGILSASTPRDAKATFVVVYQTLSNHMLFAFLPCKGVLFTITEFVALLYYIHDLNLQEEIHRSLLSA